MKQTKAVDSYRKAQEKLKREREAKGKAVAQAQTVIDALWKCSAESSAFSGAERKAVAEASYALRAISGGWLNGRRR
jgi:hypothetical protein